MKIIITEKQLIKIKKYMDNQFLIENEETDTITPIETSKERKRKCFDVFGGAKVSDILKVGLTDEILNDFDKFKCYLYYVGTKHGKTTQTREKGQNIIHLFGKIEKPETDEPKLSDTFISNLELFLLRIGRIIRDNKYSDRSILTKILDIVISLGVKNENESIDIINKSTEIMDDERFTKTRQKDLIEFIKKYEEGRTSFDHFLKRFFKRINPSMEYEKSFEHELYFVLSRTSPQVNVTLESINDSRWIFANYGITISKNEFNSIGSDLNKALYLINSIAKCDNYRGKSGETILKDVLSKLNFKIESVGDMQKRDLIALTDIVPMGRVDRSTNQPIEPTIIKKGQGVEVKYKDMNEKSYLSEFFKIDSTTEGTNKIINAISNLKNLKDSPENGYKIFMENLVGRLLIATKNTQIISNITNNLAGIIFNKNRFVQSGDIKFEWCNKGYANKDRLAVCYNAINGVPYFFEKPIEDLIFGKITGKVSE